MPFPRILIFGQSFNKNTGGGITLSNLFAGWPKNKIAVANIGHAMRNVDFSVCDTYYLLGKQEHKWVFPFSRLQRQFESGILPGASKKDTSDTPVNTRKTKQGKSYRKFIVERIFFPTLDYLGLSPKMSKIVLSEQFKNWIQEYQPDIIYVQVSSLEAINFVIALKQYIQKPVVIHMMDDWPSIINGKGPLKKYWSKKIDIALRNLMKQCALLLSISDAMTEEYERRYGMHFSAFHNPINIEEWLPFSKTSWDINSPFKILYTGRIGTANTKSIKTIADSVDFLAKSGLDISLDIYSPNINSHQAKSLKFLQGVTLKNIVPHSQIPSLLPSYDLLVLPLDFDQNSIRFAKLSMPTKASEFMISGTPVLVYASLQTALARHALKEKWACLVSDDNKTVLVDAIKKLYSTSLIREELARKAKTLAMETENATVVRKKFQDAICSVGIAKSP